MTIKRSLAAVLGLGEVAFRHQQIRDLDQRRMGEDPAFTKKRKANRAKSKAARAARKKSR